MSALRNWIDDRRTAAKPATYGRIGVYFMQGQVHLVQLKRLADGGTGLHARVSMAYPGSRSELMDSPAAFRKLLRRALRAGGFHGRHAVSAMPAEQLRIMSVSYPANAAGSESASIVKLMADRLEGQVSDYVIDYVGIRLSSRDGERLALVAASRLEHVTRYLENLRCAGLQVDFLEIGPLAIKRLIESGPAINRKNNVVVVNVGDTESHLTTVLGRRLLADQMVQFGESVILGAIARTLNLTLDVARELVLTHGLDPVRKKSTLGDSSFDGGVAATLVEIVRPEFLKLLREIDRAFLFADSESHGGAGKTVFLVGAMALWPGAITLLSTLARMPIESLSRRQMPFANDSASVATLNDQQAAEISTAVGLALRGMLSDE